MELVQYDDAERFSRIVEPIIARNEDVFSLFYGILQAIKAGKYENPYMAAVVDGGMVLALLQMTPPHPLNLVIVDENRKDETIDFIVKELLRTSIPIPSVISVKEWALLFADAWERQTGEKQKPLMDQGLYRLDQVDESLEMSAGSWRFATEADAPIIEKWFALFEEDANLDMSPPDLIRERVAAFLDAKEVFLWEDEGKVVSMMKKSRPTKNSVTVSFVFTPREERKKGYARTMVALGSKELLKDFQFCVLYTDMMNPTSNKIYKEIGYKHIADSIHIGFEK